MTVEARFRFARGDFDLDVSLDFPARGVTAVYGPSGSGKTTLLRLIAGLDRDPEGRLVVAGETWQDGPTWLPTHRRPLGYVFQEATLFPHLRVRGNLAYGLSRTSVARRRMTVEEAATLLNLSGLLDRRPDELSGGERQRVAIARALLTSPRFLLLDEPLANLDATSKDELIPFIERLREEVDLPVLYVSHAFEEVARLADHLVLIRRGRVAAAGPLLEVANRADSPLSEAADAETVIEALVEEHDEDDRLTRLAFSGGRFLVPLAPLPVGRRVRVRVMARDVSLALTRSSDSSILNILPARVDSVRKDAGGRAWVRLHLDGGAALLARVTVRSARTLALETGRPVFAQVKSIALLGPYGRGSGGS